MPGIILKTEIFNWRKALRKHGLHEKTAASVLLKPFKLYICIAVRFENYNDQLNGAFIVWCQTWRNSKPNQNLIVMAVSFTSLHLHVHLYFYNTNQRALEIHSYVFKRLYANTLHFCK